jgi:hypothetical protein
MNDLTANLDNIVPIDDYDDGCSAVGIAALPWLQLLRSFGACPMLTVFATSRWILVLATVRTWE